MKLLTSEKAEAEVIGHILILFITILGISMIALYGVPAIYSLEDMANVKNVEQAFTVLDSRASRVTLGESPLQLTNINLGGGTLTVEPNSTSNPSYMVIKDLNNTFTVTIPMGKIKYQLGDRTVAYEGGGVWAQYAGGGAVMLSPPEAHFNGYTLTLPVINIYGNSSVGGKGTGVVSFKKNVTLVRYPNTTCAEADCKNRTNPVNYTGTGKVFVNITSDYYDAWADYATSLGYTKVSTNSTKRTADIELTVVPSTLGESTYLASTITFRGLNASDPTPLENFSFRIKPTGNNLNWDIRAKSGNKRLIFSLKGQAKDPGDEVDFYIGYQHDGQGYAKPVEIWKGNKKNFTVQSDGYVYLDLLNTSINLTYSDESNVGSTDSINCNPSGEIKKQDFNSTGFSWGETLIKDTTEKPLYNITQHYFWKMAQEGDISFSQCGSQNPDPGTSTMLINYTTTGALTYLHITENRADVGIS
jgi:hypothetical protein